MGHLYRKLFLIAACIALLAPLVVRAAEDDEDEGPVDPKIKAAREARLQKATLTGEAPKDPALPKDANAPIDINAFLGGDKKEPAKPEKSAEVPIDLNQFGDKKDPAATKEKTPAAPPAASKEKEKTPGKETAKNENAIDPKKFGEGANTAAANLGPAGKGVCQACQGQRIVPILPYTPFIKIHDSDPANNPEIVPAYKPCPVCNAKANVKEFLADIKEHQEKASAKNKAMEELIGVKLIQAENQYVTVRTSLTSRELRKIMTVIEKLSAHLSTTFQSMTLLTARPDDGSIIFMTEAKAFDKVVDKVMTDGEHKDFAKKVRGCTHEGNHIQCLDPLDLKYDAHAVFDYASILIRSATNGNAPNWLAEGFGDYCEWAVLNSNQHYSIAYIAEQHVKFGTNWVADIRKLAQQGKLSKYNDMLHFDMIGMKQHEYLTCMGVVCCLVKSSPKRFDQMVQFIRDGEDPAAAMEKAYGRKIAEMERFWTQWMAQPQW